MDNIELPKLSDLDWGANLTLPSSRKLRYTPHFIGARYPCRSIGYVPQIILQELDPKSDLSVLDPFMGSGTTAIAASKYAKRIYGLEVDPYARLIASVSSQQYSKTEIDSLRHLLNTIFLKFGEKSEDETLRPSLKNIEYWFDDEKFTELLHLKAVILKSTNTKKYQEFFLAAFGDIIRAVSRAERQSLKPYISKKYIKISKSAISEFEKIATRYITAVSETHSNNSSGITWIAGDATNFELKSEVDVAITSPPYLNAMDYTRCIKLESAWVGTGDDESIKNVKSKQLGEAIRRKKALNGEHASNFARKYFSELENIDAIRFKTLIAYFDDMESNLRCTYSALRNGGSYFIIIGDSTVRGIEIPTHKILAEIAQCIGFSWKRYFQYPIRDHRTSIPRGNQGGKIDVEHVLELEK